MEFENKIRFPLKKKLLYTFLFITILPVAILGFRAITEIKNAITENISQQNLEIATIVSQEINQRIKNAQNILETAIKNPSMKKLDIDNIQYSLKSIVENFHIFKAIYLITDNEDYMSIERKRGITIVSKNKDKIDTIASIWLMTVLYSEIRGYISPIYFEVNSKFPYLYMAFQIRNQLYKRVGVLVAKLDLTAIWPVVNRIRLGKTGFASVIDENKRLIAHSNKDEIIGREIDYMPAIFKVLSGVSGSGEFVSSEDKRGYLVAYAPVSKFYSSKEYKPYLKVNWGVVVQQMANEAYAKVTRMKHRVLIILMIIFLLSVVISLLLSNHLTIPLLKLVKGAKNISSGDLTSPLKLETNDEIGLLAKQFDQMRIDLQKKIDEMEMLIEVSKDISSVLDYRQLLNKILHKNIQVLDADTGSIMLFDDESGDLIIEASFGLPHEIVTKTRVSSGQGISGWVAKTKKELIIYDTVKEPGFAELKGRKVEKGCLMSAPLIAKNKVLGVINVSKKTPYSFNERDLELFRALSIHAAIAIDNAKLYRLAITDGLTKLYIHRYFQQRMDELIRFSKENKTPFSLIMTDIDHFKSFNDTYGHQVGDEVLKTVARILMKSVRDEDIVARYGGEEFAVICPGITKEEATIPAERIRKSVEEYDFFVNGKRVQITISLGISEYGEDAIDKKMLIECADLALYYAKENGRNQFKKFSSDLLKET